MTGPDNGGPLCERARQWISLELDGELSEFERALLDPHLARCAVCRAFQLGAAGAAAHLRTTPLERLETSISLPSRARRRVSALRVGAAAAAVVAATSFGVASALRTGKSAPVRHFGGAAIGIEENDIQLAREIRRAQKVQPRTVSVRLGSRDSY